MRTAADRMDRAVTAPGGAGSLADIGGGSAVAVGSLALFRVRGMGVLVNYPSVPQLRNFLQ